MESLNIKGLPDPLYRSLQARARAECRSVAQDVVHLLRGAMEAATPISILELRGLGKEAWGGADSAAHVVTERDSGE